MRPTIKRRVNETHQRKEGVIRDCASDTENVTSHNDLPEVSKHDKNARLVLIILFLIIRIITSNFDNVNMYK